MAYGDSILEGWVASGPARAWPAVAARSLGLDVVNMGYAGAARSEMASAEQVAALAARRHLHHPRHELLDPHAPQRRDDAGDHGRLPRGGPGRPPLHPGGRGEPGAAARRRDDANRLGATLVDLRATMEEVVQGRIDAGDAAALGAGGDLSPPTTCPDGIHPGDEGHELLAEAFGGAVADALGRREG